MSVVLFPDVICLGDDHYRIVTEEARCWVAGNTSGGPNRNEVWILGGEQVTALMELDALTVIGGPAP